MTSKREHDAFRVVKRYRHLVDIYEKDAARRLARQHVIMESAIRRSLRKLNETDRTGLPMTARYENIRPAIEEQVRICTYKSERIMTDLVKQTARLGIDAASESASRIKKRDWKKVSTSGILTGGIFKGAKDALAKIPAAVMSKITDLVGQAVGMAEQGFDWLMSHLGDALSGMWSGLQRLIRTTAEQIFRRAQQQQRQEIPINGWRRIANHETACLACLMLEGRIYDRSEDFADHPNGRCYIVPCESGAKDENTGREWLENQDEATQRRVMGKKRFELWKSGELSLDDMTEVVNDPVYGPQPHVIPLKRIGIVP